jgi:hypothetical protein
MSEMVPYTYSFCRRCDSRVELGRVAYGTKVECPSCGLEFILTSPRNRVGAGEGRGDVDEKAAQAENESTAVHAVSLLPLFLSGTFTFPFRSRHFGQTLLLWAGAAALFAAFRLGAWCASADNEEVDRATRVLLWNGLLLSIVFAAVALPAWFYVASAYGMTILRETSSGVDAIGDWPNVLALEDSSQFFYLANGFFVAVMPGLLAAPLSDRLQVPLPWGIGVTAALLFPILLLSMLSANSPLHLLSLRVWKSLIHGALAWIAFHLATLALGLAVASLEIALWRQTGWATDVAATGLVAAAAWMIYFRLAGRLALAALRAGGYGI